MQVDNAAANCETVASHCQPATERTVARTLQIHSHENYWL